MSALALRLIACFCMVLDHIGYCLAGQYPLFLSFRLIGRLAFPLFVFLTVNGYHHAASRPKYALRLFLFALLSQLPYSYFLKTDDPNGNVFFTLLIALLVVWTTDTLWQQKRLKYLCFLPTLLAFLLYRFGILNSDYGMKGIFLALTFRYLVDHRIACTVCTFISVYYARFTNAAHILLCLMLGKGLPFTAPDGWEYMQLFSLLSLILIFLYNGEKGKTPKSPVLAKTFQLSFYAFYPLHMLLIRWLFS